MNCNRKVLSLALSAAFLGSASQSFAQDMLEEVLVTARKATESLQTTPVAVTALTAQMIENKQLQQVVDLQRSAPSLTMGTGGTGPPSIVYAAIRGQTQNSPNSVGDVAVGIYIDGVYMGRPIASNMGFLDVSQIEILRGPQGTLFGRNTIGGAVSITNHRPTGEFGGHVKVELGDYGLQHFEGVLNIPLKGDELAVRLSGRTATRDGYVENPEIGSDDYNDIDSSYSVRGSLLYQPADLPVTVYFAVDKAKFEDNGTPLGVAAFNDDASAAPGFLPTLGQFFAGLGLNPRDYEQSSSNFHKTYQNVQTAPLDSELFTPSGFHEATGFTLDVEVDLGWSVVKSITAYRESVSSNQNDLDGSPVDFISFFSEYDQDQISQELTISGTAGKLSLIGGLYYFHESGLRVLESASIRCISPAPAARSDSNHSVRLSYYVLGIRGHFAGGFRAGQL